MSPIFFLSLIYYKIQFSIYHYLSLQIHSSDINTLLSICVSIAHHVIACRNTITQPLFTQSDKYKPVGGALEERPAPSDIKGIEQKLWQHIQSHATKGDPVSVYQQIDKFCKKNWMMNLGPEKGVIIRDQFELLKPKTILEVGTYCGYSSVYFATLTSSDSRIYTLEVNQHTREIADKIFNFAGVENKVIQLNGNVQQNIEHIRKVGHFDVVFLDHWKNVYLQDFKFLEKNGVIEKNTTVIADNVICPGVPDYIEHLKESKNYRSVMYHSQLEYSPQIPDAVLVSTRL